MALLALTTVVLACGLPLRDEYGFRVLLGDDHSLVRELDQMIDQFGGGFPVAIGWECGPGHPCASALDPISLRMAQDVTQDLRSAKGVRGVHGPSNSPLMIPTGSGFAIRNLVEGDQIPSDAEELTKLALEDPLWVGELVSADGSVGVIIVQQVDTQSATDVAVVDEIERVIAPYRDQGFSFALEGTAVASVVAGRELAKSTARIIPFTILVIGIVVFLLSRSVALTLATLTTLGLSLLWTLGMMGWLDWPRDGIHQILAPLILLTGVCDAMHLLSRYRAQPPRSPNLDGLVSAAQDVGPACIVTTLTTGAAFLSFVLSDLDTFKRFGFISSFGVAMCLIHTFSALPLMATRIPIDSAGSADPRWNLGFDRMIAYVERRHTRILAATFMVLALFAYGWIARLEVDTYWSELVGDQSLTRQWDHFFAERIGPAETVEIQITLPPDAPLESPSTIATLRRIADRVPDADSASQVRSILDRIDRAATLINADQDPGSRASAAELLEILTLGSPDDVARWLSMDRSHVRLSATTHSISSATSRRVVAEVSRILDATVPPGWALTLGGQAASNARWARDVQATQLRSFPAALAVACVLIAIYFRSPTLTLAAMLPTILPVIVTLGAMGWLGFGLDVGRAMIAAVLIGVGVDDAVHFLTRYAGDRKAGAVPTRALRAALHHSGRAIVTTSVSLSVGFLTLTASAWQTVASFGLFIAIALLGALAATLLVLPSVLMAIDTRHPIAATGGARARRMAGEGES